MTPLLLLALAAAAAGPKGDCEKCHRAKTPGVVAPWRASAHAEAKVGCAACHGEDYKANHPEQGERRKVLASACQRCHEKATAEHRHSKHGIGFRAGRACTRGQNKSAERDRGCSDCHEKDTGVARTQVECARFLTQTPAMQRQGCMACHAVENRCDTCHGSHDTDLRVARDPAVCATCHMGPDHAQWEMWQTSRHGVIYGQLGSERGPTCADCHMVGGSHDVSLGIAHGRKDPGLAKRERERMVKICARCHTAGFSRRQLADADQIQKESKAIVDAAAALVRELDAEGLLWPSPTQRPPHPFAGDKIELGAQALYENLSRAEALYFRMKKFYYVSAFKGAYHQNPDYTHWYGNAPLKLAMSELNSEAALLRRLVALEKRLDLQRLSGGGSAADLQAVERELLELQQLRLKRAIDDATFKKRKNEILDRHGL